MTPPDSPTQRPKHPVLLAVSLLVVIALGFALELIGHSGWVDEPSDLDNVIHAWVVGHRASWPLLTDLFLVATRFGNPNVATFATAVVTIGLYTAARLGVSHVRRWEALVWVGAILGGRLMSIGLKLLFRRDRPPVGHRLVFEDTYSFPSGHSVFAAVFFTMLAVMLLRLIPSRYVWARAGAVSACLTLALTVAVSRIWLGVHYPTDVLGGLLLGFGWVCSVALARRGLGLWLGRPDQGA